MYRYPFNGFLILSQRKALHTHSFSITLTIISHLRTIYANLSRPIKLFGILVFTLLMSRMAQAATYYTYLATPGSMNFSATSSWHINPGGGGGNPTAGDLTSGAHNFIIQNGYTVTLDQNVSAAALTVGGGTSGALVFGNNTTARTLTIGSGGFTVAAGGSVTVSANDATHIFNLNGALTNNGTLNLLNTAVRRANLVVGANATFSGTGATYTLATLTINDGFTVTQAANVSINTLNIGSTTGATLTIGNDATARTLTVTTGGITISNGSTLGVGAFNATHTLTLSSNLTVNGTIDLFNNASQVANLSIAASNTISGTGTTELNNLTVTTGTVTMSRSLTLQGSITINSGNTFAAGGQTINIGGNLGGAGTYTATSANTTNFTNTSATQISCAATFGTLAFVAGTSETITGAIVVLNSITWPANSNITVTANLNAAGNFTLPVDATYLQTGGTTTFDGTAAQTIDIGTGATFNGLVFSNGGVNAKTVVGNIVANGGFTVNSGATATSSGNHIFRSNITVNGTVTFTGTVGLEGTNNITGGTNFNLGNCPITVSGAATVTANNWNINGNLTINPAASLTINSGATVTNQAATHTLFVDNGGTLSMLGASNFPSSFATVTFDPNSTARYFGSLNQTIRGNMTYGNLRFDNNFTRTLDGNVTILGNINFAGTGAAGTFGLSTFNVDFRGSTIINGNTQDGSISASAGSVFTFNGPDINQFLNNADGGSYTFGDLVFSNPVTPTAIRTRTISKSCTVLGNLTIDNPNGDVVNRLVVILGANTLSRSTAGGTIAINANAALYVSGTNNFTTTIANYATDAFDVASTVRFDGTAQDIPTATYGNIEIQGNGTKTVTGALDVNGNIIRTANNANLSLGSFSHTIAGDFNVNSLTFVTPGTSTVTFDGADQDIFTSTFNNVVFAGTGTKTLQGQNNINGNLTVNNGITLDGNTRLIQIAGNFLVNSTGVFTQTTGGVTFNGNSASAQTITSNGASIFGTLTFARPDASSSKVTRALTNLAVRNSVLWSNVSSSDENNFDLNGLTIQVGGNWTFQGAAAAAFTHNNGTVEFNGNGIATQVVANVLSTINYFTVVFSGTAPKSLNNNAFTINSNVTINSGVTVFTAQNVQVAGDWYNDGTFTQTAGTMTFNGVNQLISESTFNSVTFANSGTKTLDGTLTVGGNLTINAGVTLDVSASNYNIVLDNNFTNNGTFTARNGTVTIGNTSTVVTGGTGVGRNFYNLTIASGTATVTLSNATRVANNLVITSGFLAYGTQNLNVGGGFDASGGAVTVTSGVLTFDANSGVNEFNPGQSTFGPITLNASGATVRLVSNPLSMASTRVLTVTAGTLDLNAQAINMLGNVTVNGGTLLIGPGAALRAGNGTTVSMSSGQFRLVGDNTASANMTVNGTGTYAFSMSGGTLHALNYSVSNTNTAGMVISGGSIDATNNLRNGTFSNGAATGTYINLTGLNITSYTVTNVTFNSGPASNVTRSSGTGKFTFQDAQGPLAGNSFRGAGTTNTFVEFTDPPGIVTWDGGASDNNWASALNWSNDQVPTASTLVLLNNTIVTTSYTVNITSGARVAGRVVIAAAGAGTPIELVLNGGTLAVSGNISIGAHSTLTQTNAADQISLTGSWFNTGTFNESSSTVTFNGTGGTFNIATGGAADPFNNLVINAAGSNYSLANALTINGNFNLTSGNFDVAGYDITCRGNWTQSNLNTNFNYRVNTVTFNGTGSQTITGGRFFNLATSSTVAGSTKTLGSTTNVFGALTIGTNTILAGGSQILNVYGNWTNNVGNTGFTSSGIGTVYFIGGAQTLGGSATTFNHLFFSNTGTKVISQNLTINGDITILANVSQLDINNGVSVTGTAGGSFNQLGGTIRVLGSFPASFGAYAISGGTINYQANGAQTLQAAQYNNLTLSSISAATTKTANGNVFVAGTLSIADANTTLDMGNNTLTLSGAYVHTAGAPPVGYGTSGSFVQNGTATFNFPAAATTFRNITLAGTGTKNLAANLTVDGNMVVNSGVTVVMGTNTVTGTVGASLTLNDGATINCGITAAAALPTGFGAFTFAPNSTYRLNGTSGQTLSSIPAYGNLDIATTGTATLNGNLTVNGNLTMSGGSPALDAVGNNMTLNGATNNLRNFTSNAGTTVTLNGAINQSLTNTTAGNPAINLRNLTLAGSGTKSVLANELIISGALTINSGVTFQTNQNISLTGNLTNNGTLNHTANLFTFNGAAQNINPGATNAVNGVVFSGSGIKTFVTNGLNSRNAAYTIETGVTVDLGSLSHTIAAVDVVNNGGTWTTSAANITFDRAGDQNIPAITLGNLTTGGTGIKLMTGALSCIAFQVNAGNTFDVDGANNHPLTVRGSFTVNGTFQARQGTINFESPNATGVTITCPNTLFIAQFNNSSTAARTFTLGSNLTIASSLTLNSNAVLAVENRRLNMGTNAVRPTVTISGNALLDIRQGGFLIMNNNAGNPDIVVNSTGRINFVGVDGNIATLNRTASNANRINFNMSGTIGAQYYEMSFLANNGLQINGTGSVDNTNNFSNGTFSGINTANTGGPYYYLNFNGTTTTPTTTINNVNFNHGGTPVAGQHFNVRRLANVLAFGGEISGALGGALYERESDVSPFSVTPGIVTWPPLTNATWTGAVSTDWSTAGNWSTGVVPDNTVNVTIPSVTNNPIISSADASCRDLTITNGLLQVLNSRTLDINGSVTIGTGTNTASLISNSTGCTINVSRNWTRGTNGVFTAGNSTVSFNAVSGAYAVQPLTSNFANVSFGGGGTYTINGTTVGVTSNLTVSGGTLQMGSSGYVLNVGGNINFTGGNFSNVVAGTVVLNGSGAQSVTNGNFNNLTIGGTGTKTIVNSYTITGNLIVNSTMTCTSGANGTIAGNVTINTGAVLNNNDNTITVNGQTWTNTGSYSGVGSTVAFSRTALGTVTINASAFHNLNLNSNQLTLIPGAVTINGNLTLASTATNVQMNTGSITGTGTGTMTMNGGSVFNIQGANNFPIGFGTYSLATNSTVVYNGTANQTIAAVTYGNLTLAQNNTKTLGGTTSVRGNLTVGAATLDVSTSNFRLNLGGDFNNNSTGNFTARAGQVVFDGTIAQNINLNNAGTRNFFDVQVNKPQGITLQPTGFNMTVSNDLNVLDGNFSANGLTVSVGGDMLASGSGRYLQSGTYLLNQTSGNAAVLQVNGSVLNNLTVSPAATVTYTLQDDLDVAGNFNITAGTFFGNGRTIRSGTTNNNFAVTGGTFDMGAGSVLMFGAGSNVTVNAGAVFRAVGSPQSNVEVTRRSTGNYNFTVNGTIHARYYAFRFMGINGITVTSTGTINTTNNFSDGVFSNGVATGVLLRIENTQNLNAGTRINNVNFPTNAGNGSYNVTKGNSASGVLEFFSSTGPFAGTTFESDQNNLINWTGPIVLTWNGSQSTDWFTALNWTASSGPAIVPTSATNVVIASANNLPVIAGANAQAADLTINNGTVLTLASSTNTNTDLTVTGNLLINGVLAISSSNDRLECQGNWTRGGSGSFTSGSGEVVLNTVTGNKTFNNGTVGLFDLTLAANASVTLAANTTVNRNLTIGSGALLDASLSNFNLTIGGGLFNSGTINSRSNTVTLNATSGTQVINPGGASNSFFNLTLTPNAGVVYNITTNGLTVRNTLNINSGTLNANGNSLTVGNNIVASPSLNIVGVLTLNANSFLYLGSAAQINVNSGGALNVLGTDASNIATVTRLNASSTPYSFNVNGGATLAARFYLIEFMDASGVWLRSGSTLNATNTLQDGTLANGVSGGRLLALDNDLGSDRTIANVTFSLGASINARRTVGTGNAIFQDADGSIAGFPYEQDDVTPAAATTGRLRWAYTGTVATWVGGTSGNDWSAATNWSPTLVPTSATQVTIPNTGNNPIISSSTTINRLTINSGATLTLQSGASLTVNTSVTNSGTITIPNGSASTLSVGTTFTNSGTFTGGNSSNLALTAATGIQMLALGTSTLQNLTINSGGGSGSATFRTSGAMTVNGDVSIQAGTFQVNDATHTISVLGNWTQTGGSFVNGGGTVNFTATGAGTQTITGLATSSFNNVVLSGNRTKQLSGTVVVAGNLTNNSGTTLNLSSATLNLRRNLINNGTVNANTSTVTMTGTVSQQISTTGTLTLNNLTVNNTSATVPQVALSGNVTLQDGGVLTLTAGRISTSNTNLLTLNSTATLSGGSATSYVTGPLRKVGSANFTYPIGTNAVYARLGINTISSSSTFTARYFRALAPGTNRTYTGGLQAVAETEYWDLTRNSGTGTPFVTLFWEDGNRSQVGTVLSTLRVAHWTGTNWENLGGTVSGTSSQGSITSTVVSSSYSPFTIGTTDAGNNPLPVTYAYFRGNNVEDGVLLEWATASEINSQYFTLERSFDGKNFEKVTYVNAAGYSNSMRRYSFLDKVQSEGRIYYRLHQTDRDGTVQAPVDITVLRNGAKGERSMTLFPNPTVGKEVSLSISGLAAEEVAQVEVTTTTGQTITSLTVTGTTTGLVTTGLALPSETPAGIYLVTVRSENGMMKSRLVIR